MHAGIKSQARFALLIRHRILHVLSYHIIFMKRALASFKYFNERTISEGFFSSYIYFTVGLIFLEFYIIIYLSMIFNTISHLIWEKKTVHVVEDSAAVVERYLSGHARASSGALVVTLNVLLILLSQSKNYTELP